MYLEVGTRAGADVCHYPDIDLHIDDSVGWYTHKLETLSNGSVTESTSTRKRGYHAGFGAELFAGRHVGVHGDYRYTFIHFGDSPSSSGLFNSLRPSYGGSMWTAGVTLYF